jgi:hypothetical protein
MRRPPCADRSRATPAGLAELGRVDGIGHFLVPLDCRSRQPHGRRQAAARAQGPDVNGLFGFVWSVRVGQQTLDRPGWLVTVRRSSSCHPPAMPNVPACTGVRNFVAKPQKLSHGGTFRV